MPKEPISVFWFRRDLRLTDNAGLYHALKQAHQVLPIFIFDTTILSQLEEKDDARVTFIHQALTALDRSLKEFGSGIQLYHGNPLEVWKTLCEKYNIQQVFANRDYEPQAIKRDAEIESFLQSKHIEFHTFKDHVIFEKDEILSDSGTPYKIYTPYKRKWLATLTKFYLSSYPSLKYAGNFLQTSSKLISLNDIGFVKTSIPLPGSEVKQGIIRLYDQQRDYPALDATSKLGIHFRFGTVSIRDKAVKGGQLNDVWLSELIWRDFFIQLMYHFPHAMQHAFNAKFERVLWRYDEDDFNRWCTGTTGYPLVDAGMRELSATGHMHNRVRMVTASFLTKHLFLDWRMGEAWFAQKLLDFDLAANNGNWQWCAGTGADAQPYFRIFNPYNQQEKFDKDFLYIKKWVPEFGTDAYPKPMIEHKVAVARAKEAFAVLTKGE